MIERVKEVQCSRETGAMLTWRQGLWKKPLRKGWPSFTNPSRHTLGSVTLVCGKRDSLEKNGLYVKNTCRDVSPRSNLADSLCMPNIWGALLQFELCSGIKCWAAFSKWRPELKERCSKNCGGVGSSCATWKGWLGLQLDNLLAQFHYTRWRLNQMVQKQMAWSARRLKELGCYMQAQLTLVLKKVPIATLQMYEVCCLCWADWCVELGCRPNINRSLKKRLHLQNKPN